MTTTPASPVSQAVSSYIELMDGRASRTEQLCAAQPDRQAVRAALLRAEEEIHAHEGWGSVPRVFVLNRHAETGQVVYMVAEAWSQGLTTLPMNIADVLLVIAVTTETTRRVMDVALSAKGADLTQNLPPNLAFHGVGLMIEAYTVFGTGDTHSDKTSEAFTAGPRLSTASARVQVRQIRFYDRDGTWWEVARHRRSTEVNVPRYCIALPPGQVDVRGDVPNALSRICDAIAGNSIPVLPRLNVLDLPCCHNDPPCSRAISGR